MEFFVNIWQCKARLDLSGKNPFSSKEELRESCALDFLFCRSCCSRTVVGGGCPVSPTPWQVWNGSVPRNSALESHVKGVLFIRSAQPFTKTGDITKMLVKYFLQDSWGIKNNLKNPMSCLDFIALLCKNHCCIMKEILTKFWAWLFIFPGLCWVLLASERYSWPERLKFQTCILRKKDLYIERYRVYLLL